MTDSASHSRVWSAITFLQRSVPLPEAAPLVRISPMPGADAALFSGDPAHLGR